MLELLEWDSAVLKKKIGVLKQGPYTHEGIESDLKAAREGGYQYLMCKLESQETRIIRLLESFGFYLTDIGVTWAIKTESFLHGLNGEKHDIMECVNVATINDIPSLQSLIISLFPESRFYNDPFFSKEEADRLHVVWIENSVKGEAADVVFHISDTGFVTCKNSGDGYGDIILIGIKSRLRGKGFGTALTFAAMKWFCSQDVRLVRVRTQLRNIKAMNYYRKQGFMIYGYGMTFGKIL